MSMQYTLLQVKLITVTIKLCVHNMHSAVKFFVLSFFVSVNLQKICINEL